MVFHSTSYKTILLKLLVLFFVSLNISVAQSFDKDTAAIPTPHNNFWELGLEYYYPSHWNRQIKTINLNGLIGKEFVASIGLQIFAGVTVTHAWGNIIIVNEFKKEARYENTSTGVGPVIFVRLQPLNIGKISISAEGLGGIILYDKSFPKGGKIYNFMFRLGAAISYSIDSNYNCSIGLRRMHISNGLGVGSFNPFYEGSGLSLNLSKRF